MTFDDPLVPASGGQVGARVWSAATLHWRLTEISAAGALAGVLMILLWIEPRPDLEVAVAGPMFWVKAGYAVAIAVSAIAAATWLARGRRLGWLALGLCGGLAGAMLAAGALQAASLTRAELFALYWPTGPLCLVAILVVGAPMLVFASLGLASVETERPRLVGLAAGLGCGGVADAVFDLHCPFSTLAFVAPWHTGGVALCGLAGLALAAVMQALRPPTESLTA